MCAGSNPAEGTLSSVTLTELIDACRWLDTQSDTRVVIVNGVGRAFCAGFDLEDFTRHAEGVSPRDTADLGRRAADSVVVTMTDPESRARTTKYLRRRGR